MASWMRMRPGSMRQEGDKEIAMDTVNRILRSSIDDEARAVQEYAFLKSRLQSLGFTRFADQVMTIAKEESNHRLSLLDIQTRLARGER